MFDLTASAATSLSREQGEGTRNSPARSLYLLRLSKGISLGIRDLLVWRGGGGFTHCDAKNWLSPIAGHLRFSSSDNNCRCFLYVSFSSPLSRSLFLLFFFLSSRHRSVRVGLLLFRETRRIENIGARTRAAKKRNWLFQFSGHRVTGARARSGTREF